MKLLLALCLSLSSSAFFKVTPSYCEGARAWLEDAGPLLDQGLTPEARAGVFCALRDALADRYALWEWKGRRLGFAPEEHLDRCAAAELGARDSGRLRFEERVRVCLARFQDTHLQVRSQVARPEVLAGIEADEIEGKVRLASVSLSFLGVLARDARLGAAAAELVPGREILEIDGVPPALWLERLAPFLSGSSAGSVRSQALRALFRRDFLLPEQGTLRLRLAGSPEFELPWWSMGLNQRADLRNHFRHLGIRNISAWGEDAERKYLEALDRRGFSPETPLPAPEGLTEFYTDKGRLGLRVGKLRQGDKGICYFQLLSFDTRRWRPSPGSSIAIPFTAPFSSFAAACEKQLLPAVIDLRSNSGGDPELARALLSVFLRRGERRGGLLFSGRVTPHLEQLLELYSLGDGFPEPQDPASPVRLRLAALELAQREGRAYLPWVLQEDVVAEAGAFEQPLAVLISPWCVSSCEIAARLFRGRGKILGTPTSGTGGRYLEIGAAPVAGWRDDRHGTVEVRIPNTLFGVLEEPRAGESFFLDFSPNQHLLGENAPLLPLRELKPVLGDLESGGQELLRALAEQL